MKSIFIFIIKNLPSKILINYPKFWIRQILRDKTSYQLQRSKTKECSIQSC